MGVMMSGACFPSEAGQLASLEARLKEDISLQGIAAIEEQIPPCTTGKTQQIALNLLNCCERRRSDLLEKQIDIIRGTNALDKKIKLFAPLMQYLDPALVEKTLLEFQVAALDAADPKIKKSVNHLFFRQENPLLEDFEDFVARVGKIAARIRQEQSILPLKAFNDVQLKEIGRQATALELGT